MLVASYGDETRVLARVLSSVCNVGLWERLGSVEAVPLFNTACPRLFPNVKEACSTAALLRTLRHRTPTSTVPMLRTLESRAIFASFVFENSEIFQGCIAAS